MDLIDKEDDVGVGCRLSKDILDPLLKVTSVLRACYHRTHIYAVYGLALKDIGNVAGCDLERETFCDSRLTYTGITYETRIVLCPSCKDLHDSVDLLFSSDNGIDLAVLRHLSEVLSELVEGLVTALLILVFPRAFSGRSVKAVKIITRFADIGARKSSDIIKCSCEVIYHAGDIGSRLNEKRIGRHGSVIGDNEQEMLGCDNTLRTDSSRDIGGVAEEPFCLEP